MSTRTNLHLQQQLVRERCREKTATGNVYYGRQAAKRKVRRLRFNGHEVTYFHCDHCSAYHVGGTLSYANRLKLRLEKKSRQRMSRVVLRLLGTDQIIQKVRVYGRPRPRRTWIVNRHTLMVIQKRKRKHGA